MESKRKNVYIVIFVITTIIASCVAVYFGIMGKKETEKLQAKVDELNSTNNKIDASSQKINNEQNINKESTSTSLLNNDELVKKFNSIIFNPSKYSSPNEKDSDGNVFTNITKDFRNLCYVSLYFDTQKVEISYEEQLLKGVKTNVQHNMAQEVKGLNKKVVDFIVGGQSQEIIFPMVFFLMEDGTISYLNTKKAAQTGDFTVSNNLNNLKNIVKIQEINGYVSGYVAIDIDGNSYNLAQQFINECKYE